MGKEGRSQSILSSSVKKCHEVNKAGTGAERPKVFCACESPVFLCRLHVLSAQEGVEPQTTGASQPHFVAENDQQLGTRKRPVRCGATREEAAKAKK